MQRGAVLITGASTGIGEATAYHLSSRGHEVFAGVRTPEDQERLASRSGGRITPMSLDVTDADEIEVAAKTIGAAVGDRGLAGLVNNAGIARGGPTEYTSLDVWRLQFEVNVFGHIEVTRQMLPLIRKARGRIVFVGSIGGRMSSPFLAPYNASKFALEAIADSLRIELLAAGIRVSLIEPGAVKTAIWEKGRETTDELEQNLPPIALERYGNVLERARRVFDFLERQGVPPEKVAKTIERALTSSRPRTRYMVGRDARMQALVARFVPYRVRDAVTRRVLGL
jgi:NAD(P)-dependent dehydrogenase (short-subunit alcohol dehydrogenase family)